MRTTKSIEKYFQYALVHDHMKFTMNDSWLRVEVQTPKSYTPSVDGFTYTLVCALDTVNYTPVQLCNRITYFLVGGLTAARQDVNGLMLERKEYK